MSTGRRQRFVLAQAVWMLGALAGLAVFGLLSLRLYFLFVLLGLLFLVEMTAPFAVTPAWRWRLRILLAVVMAAFGYIVVKRVLALLPKGMF